MKYVVDLIPAVIMAVFMTAVGRFFNNSDFVIILASTLATGFYYMKRTDKRSGITVSHV